MDADDRGQRTMQDFFQNSPKYRLLDGDPTMVEESVLAHDPELRTLTMPNTHATLTYDFAPVVLAHFVNCLPYDAEDDSSIVYTTTVDRGKFRCEVKLPARSPICSAEGRLHSRKLTARRSAAFNACILLIKGQYLDESFLSQYRKSLPKMRNALLALNIKNQKRYTMKSKPNLWEIDRDTLPGVYYLSVIHLMDTWDRPVQPLGLLTRHALPDFPEFPIIRLSGQSVSVRCSNSTRTLLFNDGTMSVITDFTLTLFKDIFNKKFENVPSRMSYWMVPLVETHFNQAKSDAAHTQDIDWDILNLVASKMPESWTPQMPPEHLLDKFLIDPWKGGTRYFTISIATDLKPTDPAPIDATQTKKGMSIIEASVNLFKMSASRCTWDPHQPVLVAQKMSNRLDVLRSPDEKDRTAAIITKYVCPEPLRISRVSTRLLGRTFSLIERTQLPTKLAAMALIMPSVIHRIESYLIALEFCNEVNLIVTPALALEAITKDSDSSAETATDRITVQTGMGQNYERLEFLGDCFLKMATSISIFVLHSGYDEYAMHVDRMCMLCNKNLFNNATEREWYKYIRGLSFQRSAFPSAWTRYSTRMLMPPDIPGIHTTSRFWRARALRPKINRSR